MIGDPATTTSDDGPFLERVMRYLEDDLSPSAVKLLEEELARDRRKREAFALICISDTLAHEELPAMMAGNPIIDEHPESPDAQDSLHDAMVLPAIGRDSDGHDSADSDDQPIYLPSPQLPSIPVKRRSWIKLGSWAAVVLLGLIVSLIIHLRPRPAAVATLTAAVDAQWTDSSSAPAVHESLVVGQEISLRSGCAGLVFPNSTQLIAEGPVRLRVTGPGAVELLSGKISVKMAAGQSGFVVTTPGATVTDLGTEFGVEVDPAEKSTDVHVFGGKVEVAIPGSAATPTVVVIGGLAHVSSRSIQVTPDASQPQKFVRDLGQSPSLELADLLSAGDGTGEHRGGVLDPVTGKFGIWGTLNPWYDSTTFKPVGDNHTFHRTTSLPAVDGLFVPAGNGVAHQIDSAGDKFTSADSSGGSTMRLCVAGSVAPLPDGKTITPQLGGTNFSFAGHSYVMLCPNIGITLDLAAIGRIHPAARITRFRCGFGKFGPADASSKAGLVVLVDGIPRFIKSSFTASDGLQTVDVPLPAGARFLTIVTTDNKSANPGNDVFVSDAYLDQVQK